MEGKKGKETSSKDDIYNQQTLANISVIQNILQESGVTNYEPGVLIKLLNAANIQAVDLLKKTQLMCEKFEKPLETEDILLSIELNKLEISKPPSTELIQELAKERNSKPLPEITPHDGLLLPPNKYCLTEEKIRLKRQSMPVEQPTAQQQMRANNNMDRSYSMKGGRCVIKHNAEAGQNGLSPERNLFLQPKPGQNGLPPERNMFLQPSPGQNGLPPERNMFLQPRSKLGRPPKYKKYSNTALRMNASVIPAQVEDFKRIQQLNITRKKNLTPLVKQPLPEQSNLQPAGAILSNNNSTITVTRDEDLKPQMKQPLLPIPEKLNLQPAGYMINKQKPRARVTRENLIPQVRQSLPEQLNLQQSPLISRKKKPKVTVTREEEPSVPAWTTEQSNLQGTANVQINQFNFPISWKVHSPTGDINLAETEGVNFAAKLEQQVSSDFTLEQQLSSCLVIKEKKEETDVLQDNIKARLRRKRKHSST